MDYNSQSLADLRLIAKEKGLKGISTYKKSELIEQLIKLETAPDNQTEMQIERMRVSDIVKKLRE